MNKEERQAMKEQKKKNKEANKMLIPAPKRTVKSLNLLNFDPAGTFHFSDNRWLRVYEVYGKMDLCLIKLKRLQSEIVFSGRILPGQKDIEWYVSLVCYGEIYEDVRKQFAEDEAVLQKLVGTRPLNVDETVMLVQQRLQGESRQFSYASFVRSRKDLFVETFPKIEDSYEGFQIEGSYGSSLFIMNFPQAVKWNTFTELCNLQCPVFLTFQLANMTEIDRDNYLRMLEKRYCRNLSGKENSSYFSLSCQLSYICDSADARDIVKNTIISLFSKAGYVIAPMYGKQKEGILSDLSLGIIESRQFRNVDMRAMEGIFEEEKADDNNKV